MSAVLNTLYVTVDGARLSKDGETVVVTVEKEKRAQVPLRHLSSISCLSRAFVTPELMAECAELGIFVSFFGHQGRFLARVEGMPGGNVLLRRQQFRAADDAARTLALARAMVIGKVANARQFLLHARRDAQPSRQAALGDVCHSIAHHLRALEGASTVDVVRGLEGVAAKDYFAVLPLLVKREEKTFAFEGRNRRPPRDPFNALLSFGYALLMQDCAGALAGVGLDPAVGFLHEDRPGRLSLALDLMEELRIPVVDRLVLSLINRGQIGPGDFRQESAGGVLLSDTGRKTFLVAYQEAKPGTLRHPFLEQSTTWGQVPHLQALLLARTVRGELDAYPPFSLR